MDREPPLNEQTEVDFTPAPKYVVPQRHRANPLPGETVAEYAYRCGRDRPVLSEPIRLGPWEDQAGARDPHKMSAAGGASMPRRHTQPESSEGTEHTFDSL